MPALRSPRVLAAIRGNVTNLTEANLFQRDMNLEGCGLESQCRWKIFSYELSHKVTLYDRFAADFAK